MAKQQHLQIKIDPYIDLLEEIAEIAVEWRKETFPLGRGDDAEEKLLGSITLSEHRKLVEAVLRFEKSQGGSSKRDPTESQSMDHLINQFIDLEMERIRLEAAVKRNAETIKEMTSEESPLYQGWLSHGYEKVTRRGRTVFMKIDTWLFKKKDVPSNVAVTTLKRAHLGSFVGETYNAQSLRSWLNERLEAKKPLPPSIEKVFEITRRPSFRTNAARR